MKHNSNILKALFVRVLGRDNVTPQERTLAPDYMCEPDAECSTRKLNKFSRLRKKSKLYKVLSKTMDIYILFFVLVALHYCRRIFIAEKFIIPTYSMYPTLIPGDRIMVNKLCHGARIYKSFDFEDHVPMKSFRLPGFRKIHPGDVVAFNEIHPYGDWSRIEFQINKVYCKRVFGTPGDSISIVNGVNHNNHHAGVIGLEDEQVRMNAMPDSLFMQNFCFLAYPIWQTSWTIKNMGPLYVPSMGDSIELSELHCNLYRPLIEFETGKSLEYIAEDSVVLLSGRPVAGYRFKNNYYYVLGDNSVDSNDSRYWGFVPEEFMIGVATHILFCKDRETGKLRWERLWKRL